MRTLRQTIAILWSAFIGLATHSLAQTSEQSKIPYGNNPQAGHYLLVDDARIYYEVYGQGKPVIQLHGGLYGYIDEYQHLIPPLSKHYQVIAIADRGHGKSEIGRQPLTYKRFAQDTYHIIKAVTNDSATVIGFSSGGYIAYILTVDHPEVVKRVVAMGAASLGANERTEEVLASFRSTSGADMEKQMASFITT